MMRAITFLFCLFGLWSFAFAQQGENLVAGDYRDRWKLTRGEGSWETDPLTRELCLTVSGSGRSGDANKWSLEYPFDNAAFYRITCQVKASLNAPDGVITIGASFACRDVVPGEQWQEFAFYLQPPQNTEKTFLLFGQWQVDGKIYFKDIRVSRAQTVNLYSEGIRLGSGERLRNGIYRAVLNIGSRETNTARFLQDYRGFYNTDKWDLHADDFLLFRHDLKDGSLDQLSGRLAVSIGYYERGNCAVQVSRDKSGWTTLAEVKQGQHTVQLPDDLFPASAVYVRLKVSGLLARLQIVGYSYRSQVSDASIDLTGQSECAEIVSNADNVDVRILSAGNLRPGQNDPVVVQIENRNAQSLSIQLDSENKGSPQKSIAPNEKAVITLPPEPFVKDNVDRTISIKGANEKAPLFTARMNITVPYLHQADYGSLIEVKDGVSLWWTDGARKIGRNRPAPVKPVEKTIRFNMAKNEYEPMQLVIRPESDLDSVRFWLTPPRHQDGSSTLHNVRVFLVDYVPVENPTDAVGLADDWPDPLPPVDEPFDIKKNQNQPLWILVYVPASAKSGDYLGTIHLQAHHWKVDVPLHVHVWDFQLPKENHLRSAFGFSPSLVKEYHHFANADNLTRIIDRYFESFARHRLSPYDPFVLRPIKTTMDADNKTVDVDFAQFDRAGQKYLDGFGFNSFRLLIDGLARGSHRSHVKGSLGGFDQDSPEYRQLLSDYLKKVQDHLEGKGWLDKAYLYWFDEPQPDDYAFIKEVNTLIRDAAPRLTRMLTEQPEDELTGYVDLWCPMTPAFDERMVKQRQNAGEKVWWYVCTSPKEPYCTLFIDHYAVELRTWIWQTWKYGLDGILIWQANYWNSDVVYPPPSRQNPYDDPMSYSGEGGETRFIQNWGNGDGRFLYPPKEVFQSNERCEKGPVSSIRWEMLREGMEDYEYFWLLRDLIRRVEEKDGKLAILRRARELLEVPQNVTASLTEFSKKPEPIYQHREKLARMIVELQKKL